jgi:actin-related protein 3
MSSFADNVWLAAARASQNSVSTNCGPSSALPLTKTSGFAGNDAPSFVFPTAIATKGPAGGGGGSGSGRPAVANKPSYLTGGAGPGSQLSAKRGTEDLDFFIGDEALAAASGPSYGIHYPVRHGLVENWDHMERFWSNSIFKYLRVEPEDHYFLLTEPVGWLRNLLSHF